MPVEKIGFTLFSVALIVVGGCAGEDDSFTPICENVDGSEECGEHDEDSDGACTLDGDGEPRTVFRCNGSFTVSIGFRTLLGDCEATLGDPDQCEESHDFGLGFDAHGTPAVMACCDAEATPTQELLEHCGSDLVEQMCRSLPTRLDMLIEEGAIKLGKQQAKRLRNWLETHQQQCYRALHQPSGVPGSLAPAAWLVNGGDHEKWPALRSFTVMLEQACVSSATLPEDQADRVSCHDNDLNNAEIFERREPALTEIDAGLDRHEC